MQCDICHKNEAVFHIKEVREDQVSNLHICRACANGKGVSAEQLPLDLSSLVVNLAAEVLPETNHGPFNAAPPMSPKAAAMDKTVCVRCGLTAGDFRRTGQFGCPECYQAFADILEPGLEAVHRGLAHTGRVPAGRPPAQSPSAMAKRQRHFRLSELREELERAVAAEAYEKAAELRDRIAEVSQPSQRG